MPDELFVELEKLIGEEKAVAFWGKVLARIDGQTEMLEGANGAWQQRCAELEEVIAALRKAGGGV